MAEPVDKVRENRVRRIAARLGYQVQKSRVRSVNLDDLGGYRLVEPRGSYVVAGQRFELDLDDVEAWLQEAGKRSPLLTPEEIDLRMAELAAAGFPPAETKDFAEGLVKYTPGPHGEAVIRRLVLEVVDRDAVEELVAKHVATIHVPGTVYCRSRPMALVDELARRGVGSRQDAEGWRVSWPGGETLEGKEPCRIGLLAVWLKYMREEGGMETPAY